MDNTDSIQTTKKEESFNGFPKKTFQFLIELKNNNNKVWFATHRNEYEEYLLKPLVNLVMDISNEMMIIDANLIHDKRAVSRIYADTRFSKNKSPYKTTMWVTFKRPRHDWQDSPAFFFELSADSYRYGMGFYGASPATMRKYRETIEENPQAFATIISFLSKQNNFVIEGEKYKRHISNNLPENFQEWYQRRNIYLVCNKKNDMVLESSELSTKLICGFRALKNIYYYFLSLK
ncbi:MAG: DUF2461 domain-containing protein [bacterium]